MKEHLTMFRELFRRIEAAKLTVKPSKYFVRFNNIGFIGHVIGNGVVHMEEKLIKIKHAAVPKTKRQLKAFLGLAGYYRKFMPFLPKLPRR